jgi:hypothetical protein
MHCRWNLQFSIMSSIETLRVKPSKRMNLSHGFVNSHCLMHPSLNEFIFCFFDSIVKIIMFLNFQMKSLFYFYVLYRLSVASSASFLLTVFFTAIPNAILIKKSRYCYLDFYNLLCVLTLIYSNPARFNNASAFGSWPWIFYTIPLVIQCHLVATLSLNFVATLLKILLPENKQSSIRI